MRKDAKKHRSLFRRMDRRRDEREKMDDLSTLKRRSEERLSKQISEKSYVNSLKSIMDDLDKKQKSFSTAFNEKLSSFTKMNEKKSKKNEKILF